MTTPAGAGLRLQLPDPGSALLAGRAAAMQHPPSTVTSTRARARTTPRRLPRSLRLAILVPRTDVGGGARILFEHANRLASRGHEVTVLSYLPAPQWFELRVPFVQVPTGLELTDLLPECDLVVCGYWEGLAGVAAAEVAPVVHFEQGDYHLYEDLTPEQRRRIRTQLRAADAHTAVSANVQRILRQRFGVASTVVPNAVDGAVFAPGPARGAVTPVSGRRSVLCVGWDGNDFKGIDEVRGVATLLRQSHPDVDVVWVTPKPPVADPGDVSRVFTAPTQQVLADLYRSASVYLCASRYESFPLPPMEAMASGTPVVTTANTGSLEYAVHGVNALVVPVRDVIAQHAAVCRLLDDADLSRQLQDGGCTTAAAHTWDAITTRLEEVYREVAERLATPPVPAGWAVPAGFAADVTSLTAAKRLELAMRRSGAAQIVVPVRRPLLADRDVWSWEVAATRQGGRGKCRVWAPHAAQGTTSILPYQDAVTLLGRGRAAEALTLFERHRATAEDRATRGALGRWIALALLMSGRGVDALTLLTAEIEAHPDNPDCIVLLGEVLEQLNGPGSAAAVEELARTSGTGARYTDFFTNGVLAGADGSQDRHVLVELRGPAAAWDGVVQSVLRAFTAKDGVEVVFWRNGRDVITEGDAQELARVVLGLFPPDHPLPVISYLGQAEALRLPHAWRLPESDTPPHDGPAGSGALTSPDTHATSSPRVTRPKE